MKNKYSEFIEDYIDLEHMEEVPESEGHIPDDDRVHLPHHSLFKLESTTRKLRVVFDGSTETSNGNSLNDVLAINPIAQKDLFAISLPLRLYPIGLSADVARIYRQVASDKSD